MRMLAFLVAILGCVTPARADKIVLKNGRVIVANNVKEEGDKVQYETSAGELSIPKSIVDHIEKGGLLPTMASPAAAAANLNMAPPPVEATANGAEIDQAAVHDGSVDRDYIARLEGLARGGGARANQKAALAHHAAAQFELAHGDLEHALSDEETAVGFAPEQPALLMNVAYLHLKRSEFKQSLDYVEKAKDLAPESADVYKLEGWSYYGMNRPDQAVEAWKKALALRPDADTQAALEKALRDKAEEESYREGETAHFALKYYGSAAPALARGILHTLEDHFSALESELDYTPPEQIGVILYTGQAFADITRAPGWVGALNDGRIRVPVQGLSSVTPDLSRVLKHELTHSFVQQKTRGRCPVWLQEGVAQWMEGRRSRDAAASLVALYDRKQMPSLGSLEGSWMGLSGDAAVFAYAWALAAVETIVETQGKSDLERLLDQVAVMPSTEAALKESLRSDYSDLEQQTIAYLRRTYLH
jgi:tetratricopeptide (TPR) repeat protein